MKRETENRKVRDAIVRRRLCASSAEAQRETDPYVELAALMASLRQGTLHLVNILVDVAVDGLRRRVGVEPSTFDRETLEVVNGGQTAKKVFTARGFPYNTVIPPTATSEAAYTIVKKHSDLHINVRCLFTPSTHYVHSTRGDRPCMVGPARCVPGDPLKGLGAQGARRRALGALLARLSPPSLWWPQVDVKHVAQGGGALRPVMNE